MRAIDKAHRQIVIDGHQVRRNDSQLDSWSNRTPSSIWKQSWEKRLLPWLLADQRLLDNHVQLGNELLHQHQIKARVLLVHWKYELWLTAEPVAVSFEVNIIQLVVFARYDFRVAVNLKVTRTTTSKMTQGLNLVSSGYLHKDWRTRWTRLLYSDRWLLVGQDIGRPSQQLVETWSTLRKSEWISFHSADFSLRLIKLDQM